MALVEIVKYNGALDEFIWKYPRDDLGTWAQLIVNEIQGALLLKDGKICDLFTSGKYILESKNIPILNNIINIPFGGESLFKVEVWFTISIIASYFTYGAGSFIFNIILSFFYNKYATEHMLKEGYYPVDETSAFL